MHNGYVKARLLDASTLSKRPSIHRFVRQRTDIYFP